MPECVNQHRLMDCSFPLQRRERARSGRGPSSLKKHPDHVHGALGPRIIATLIQMAIHQRGWCDQEMEG